MKKHIAILSLTAAATLVGCTSKKEVDTTAEQIAHDRAAVTMMTDTAVKNGIIAQHTLYPYHFVADSAQLNELGVKELAVLSDHYKSNAGTLVVRQGGTADGLYKSRVEAVTSELKKAGVFSDRVAITDGMVGGPGMSSERVNAALKEEVRLQQQGASSSTTSMNAAPTPNTPSQP